MGGYPEYIMEYLRQRRGLDESETSADADIMSMSPDEAFDEVCNWNGLIGYGSSIRDWISDIYGFSFE